MLTRSLTTAAEPSIELGFAVRDITPHEPIWLAGYAARKHSAEKADQKLVAQAVAFRTGDEQFVLLSVDNCEVNRRFTTPIYERAQRELKLKPGAVMIVSSHTHSAPVLAGALEGMYPLSENDTEHIRHYSSELQETIFDAIKSALSDLQPARLEAGQGRATFAMNRRIYREDGVTFGENPDGPVDWDVPVLKVLRTDGSLRAVLFGYACHGTSIAGDDFYIICGDYMAYAREHLEKYFPGTTAVYLTGMGADSNPSPRGTLLDAKRHGLELAGAVTSVLNRPMRPVNGRLKFAFAELNLPLAAPPPRETIQADTKSSDLSTRNRAASYIKMMDGNRPLPSSVPLPLGVVRLGDDLTFIAMGGEPVVDYGIQLKRIYATQHPWLVGYAYEVPCYIPTMRILKEGGYEAQSSLIYYGYYGPFQGKIEPMIMKKFEELVTITKQN